MKKKHYPAGWDEARVERLIGHYENMSDDEMIAEDEAAHEAGENQLSVPKNMPKTNGLHRRKKTKTKAPSGKRKVKRSH